MDTEVRPGLATRAYVISPKEIEPGWVTLYAITFVIEVFCAGGCERRSPIRCCG